MRLVTLVSSGIKAIDRSLTLGRLVVLLGPVGSGKSTTLDAIRFLALGHVPRLGARESDTIQLAREGSIQVTGSLEDGRVLGRGLVRKGSSCINSASASWLPEDATTGQEGDAIRALFGASALEAAEHLDLRTLLDAGQGVRAKRVEAMLDPVDAGDTANWMWALAILKMDGREADRMPDELPLAMHLAQASVAALPKEMRDLAQKWEEEVGDMRLSEALAEAGKRKSTNAKAASGAIAARAAIEKRLGELPRPSETRQALEASLADATRRRTEAERDLAEAGRIEKLVGGDTAALKVFTESDGIDRKDPPTLEDCASWEADADQLQRELYCILTIEIPASSSDAKDAALQAYERAIKSPWRDAENRIHAIRSLTADPYIEQHLNALEALVANNGGDVHELKRVYEVAFARWETTDAARRHASLESARAGERRSALMNKIAISRTKARDGRRQREVFEAEAKRRDTLEARIAGLRAGAPTRSSEELKLARFEAETEELSSRAKLQELIEADARRSEMEAQVRNVETATAARDFYAAAEWALKRLRERDMGARSGGLLEVVREFLRGAGRTEEPYLRAEKGDLEFGWVRGAKEIPEQLLSGGESALFCTGLHAAVIANRKPEVKILLLEAAELGSGDALLDTCRGAQSILSHVDQVILATNADVDSVYLMSHGWDIISS